MSAALRHLAAATQAAITDRFWDKVDTTGVCWEWTRALTDDGYGKFWIGRVWRAHLVAWILLVGPLPEGLLADHQCRNRRCVNPDHIEWVPQLVNDLRGSSFAAANARKTHCPARHLYDAENTRWRTRTDGKSKYRVCRQCERDKRTAPASRDAALVLQEVLNAPA